MPAPITWAHALTRGLANYRKTRAVSWASSGREEPGVGPLPERRPVEITRIVVSTQHNEEASVQTIRDFVLGR